MTSPHVVDIKGARGQDKSPSVYLKTHDDIREEAQVAQQESTHPHTSSRHVNGIVFAWSEVRGKTQTVIVSKQEVSVKPEQVSTPWL